MSDDWILVYDGLDAKQEGLREALCTLGNGYFATRGAAEEQQANGTNYPGTYVAGGYNQLESEVAGRSVVNEDLVNFPNWLRLTFRPADGEWLDLWHTEVLDYRQELDLRAGVLLRRMRIRDTCGRVTRIESRRFVHMGKPNHAGLKWELTAENWSGEIVLRAGLDGSVINSGVARYRQLNSKHLEIINRTAVAPAGIYLKVRTCQSHLELALAARTRVFRGQASVEIERRIVLDEPERIDEELRVAVAEGEPLRVEKVVALFTSRDRGISECGVAARLAVERAADFDTLLGDHTTAWARLWQRCDVEIDGDGHEDGSPADQLVLRLHLFHTLQTASPHTVGRDVGIPARGLHGEAYRGHIFWDEVWILPFYIQHLPAVARSAILYRYHRLDAARRLACHAGCDGAAFPWQSSSDGREATQQLHLNPLSGQWNPDYSSLQRHVNSAIVYNVWRYYEATADRSFIEDYGAEIILEIARFWSSLAKYNPQTGRYDIEGVMGPDEYHEKYPGALAGGLKNNTYTNVTAVWCLLRALDVVRIISSERSTELRAMLGIGDTDLERWDDVSRKMTVIFHDGVMSQFEGYADLEEFDWADYAERYGSIERLDRILKAEGTTPDRFKASKQADVTMLFYLFSPEELRGLLERLGYSFDDEAIRRNVEYYQARTSHGSTLSKVVFTSIVHRQDSEAGCELFLSALRSDLYDVQGGTTPEGVHLGAMGGTVDIVMRHYGGLELTREGVRLAPDMPLRVHRLHFRFQYRGRWYAVELTHSRLRVSVDDAEPAGVVIRVWDDTHTIPSGGSLELDMEPLAVTRRRPSIQPGKQRRIHVDVQRLAGAAPASSPDR